MYNIGSLAAIFFTGPTNDYFGRRVGMFTGAAIIVVGTCVQAPSTSRAMFLGGRFILGFGTPAPFLLPWTRHRGPHPVSAAVEPCSFR